MGTISFKCLITVNTNSSSLDSTKMSLLYKLKEEQTTTCEIKQEDGKIVIDFWADCGKFGTDEMLDGYKLTPERLLQILHDRDDYSEDEL